MRGIPLAATFLCAFALPARLARAAEFVLTDVTYEHSTATTVDAHFTAPISATAPKNWQAPVDYVTGGSWRVRLDVMTKPTSATAVMWFCASGTRLPGAIRNYDCTVGPAFTAVGPQDWTRKIPVGQVDWSKPLSRIDFILKDGVGAKVSPDRGYVGADKYHPMRVRGIVTIIGVGDAGAGGVDAASEVRPGDARDDGPSGDATRPPDDAAAAGVDATGTRDGGAGSPDARPRPDLPLAPVVDDPPEEPRPRSGVGGCALAGTRTQPVPTSMLAAGALGLVLGSAVRRARRR